MPAKIVLKPAVEKLSLAVRKNVRDDWEKRKPDFEEELSTLLGEKWNINANPNLIAANIEDESRLPQLGSVISWYIEPLVNNVKNFLEKYGDDGKTELNSTVTQHVIDFGPQDTTKYTYSGLVIEAGVLRLVFAKDAFASNVDDASKEIATALKNVNAEKRAYNIIARNSVKENYDSKISETQEKIGELVGVKDIKLTPNFEQNAEKLSKGKNVREDWDRILGQATLDYFEGLAYQLERAGFQGDDMIQEGFQEGVSKNEIELQVVDKLEKSSYNEVVIKDGVLRLQTTPESWWVNVSDVGSKILDIL